MNLGPAARRPGQPLGHRRPPTPRVRRHHPHTVVALSFHTDVELPLNGATLQGSIVYPGGLDKKGKVNIRRRLQHQRDREEAEKIKAEMDAKEVEAAQKEHQQLKGQRAKKSVQLARRRHAPVS